MPLSHVISSVLRSRPINPFHVIIDTECRCYTSAVGNRAFPLALFPSGRVSMYEVRACVRASYEHASIRYMSGFHKRDGGERRLGINRAFTRYPVNSIKAIARGEFVTRIKRFA